MPEAIRIQQALFGYRDGHNLLTSSVILAPRVRHFLATVTDSPGTEGVEGFGGGCTGVSVPETDYYAVFRTWLAPEMPRPGCVWSHVLLIELTDLARIPDLLILRKLFQRPSAVSRLAIAEYRSGILLDHQAINEPPFPDIDRLRASVLLKTLYEQTDCSVVILDSDCAGWETIIFEIWSQQWPRLRRNFSFSTYSSGDRRLAGTPFDLQIAPVTSERLWRRKGLPTFISDFTHTHSQPSEEPGWLTAAIDDLQFPTESQLRHFLQMYGSDIEQSRRAFVQLVNAHLVLAGELGWRDRLHAVAMIFPNSSEALRLKEMLLAPEGITNLNRQWETAAFLLGAPEAKAFAKVSFDHVGLAPDLWSERRGNVLELTAQLVRRDENPTSTTFVKAIAKCVTIEDLPKIANRHPELIPVFISQRTDLAQEIATWELPGFVQSQIFEALEGLELSQEEWSNVMGAMFVAATFISVSNVVRKAGQFAMKGAYRWLDNGVAEQLLPSREWRYALNDAAVHELGSGNPLSPSQLALCLWIVPTDIIRRQVTSTRPDMIELSRYPLDTLPKPLRTHTAFVLVTVGLRSKHPEAVRLIKRGYFLVYEVLAKSQATGEEWDLLGPEMPKVGWGEWDRCEKLRRAVRKWVLKHTKTLETLLNAAATPREAEIARELIDPERPARENDDFID